MSPDVVLTNARLLILVGVQPIQQKLLLGIIASIFSIYLVSILWIYVKRCRWNFRFWAMRRCCKPERSLQKGPSMSIVTRLALHFSMLEVAPSAKTVVTCSKARLGTAVVHVVLYRKACVVPLHSPKSLLTLGFSEVTRWDHSKFSSFHYLKLVTYPMLLLYDIIILHVWLYVYPHDILIASCWIILH